MFSGVGYAAGNKVKARSKLQQKRLKINPMTDNESAWIANIETDVYRAGTFENITVGYSANNGWDISLSLLNAQVLGNNNQFQGNTFFNIAKTFDINNDFSITAGTQNGIALANVQPQLWFNFNFLDNRYDVTPWLLLHGKCGNNRNIPASWFSDRRWNYLHPKQIVLTDGLYQWASFAIGCHRQHVVQHNATLPNLYGRVSAGTK